MSITSDRCLVLNKGWAPLTTISMDKALVLVFRQRARIVDTHGSFEVLDWDAWVKRTEVEFNGIGGDSISDDAHRYIRTPSRLIEKPEVVTLSHCKMSPNHDIPFSRRGLYSRDQFQCQYCGLRLKKKDISMDHVIPVSRGGATSWDNCVLACMKCNHKKGNKTPHEAGMKLIHPPRRPTGSQVVLIGAKAKPSWVMFLK